MKSFLSKSGLIVFTAVAAVAVGDTARGGDLQYLPASQCREFAQRRADSIKRVLDAGSPFQSQIISSVGRCGMDGPGLILVRRLFTTKGEAFIEMTFEKGARYIHWFATKDNHANVEISWLCNDGGARVFNEMMQKLPDEAINNPNFIEPLEGMDLGRTICWVGEGNE